MKPDYLLFALLLLFFIPSSYSQTFNYILANDAITTTTITNDTYQVDIIVQSTNASPIEFATLSLGFSIDNNALNGGTPTASFVAGSSQLTNTAQIPTTFNAATVSENLRIIKVVGKIPPGAGSGSLLSNVYPGTRIGRLQIKNTVAFSAPINLDTASRTLYPTAINAYVGGINTNITSNGTIVKSLSYNYTAPTCILKAINPVQLDANNVEFDLAITNTSSYFTLAGGIYSFNFNNEIVNSGTLTMNLISSDLPLNFQTGNGIIGSSDITVEYIPSFELFEIHKGYVLPQNTQVIIGHYRLTNSNTFSAANLGLTWSRSNTTLYYLSNDVGSEGTIYSISGSRISFNDLTPDLPLPVELSSFTSNINERIIELNWETKTEINSNKFEIERSNLKDNLGWTNLGSIKAATLSNSPKQYSFIDKNLQSGKYQYRLKMIDNDGTFEYSKVIDAEISIPKNFKLSQNYPNPFNPSTKINYTIPLDSKVILEVFDLNGVRISQLVNKEQSAGYYSVDFGSSKLSSGVYFYSLTSIDKLTGKNYSANKKMLLIK